MIRVLLLHLTLGNRRRRNWAPSFRCAALGAILLCAGVILPPSALADRLQLVAFGDSLIAGYGLPPDQSFPAQLEAALRKRGHDIDVINAGVSGDTTSGGLARFDWAIPEGADAVILELGANDSLRGLPPQQARDNLDKILSKLNRLNVPVLIAGMRALSNWGPDYAKTFDAIYPELAAKYDALLYPFFLDGVIQEPALNQPDGLHPNAQGVAVIVENIISKVEQLLGAARRLAPEAGRQPAPQPD